MKKLFKFALVAFASAAVVVACGKKDDPTPTPDPDPDPTPDPTPEKVEPVQGTSEWSVIGALLDTNWDTDFVCAENNGVFVLKNVKLVEGNEFKFRKDKDWAVNFGGEFAVLGEGFAVSQDGPNIKGIAPGVYDLYLNAALAQAAVCAKDATPTWAEPQGQSFDYVMDITDYHRNSEFHFAQPLSINTSACTMQWKFFPTKWNDYDKVDEERGYKVWCNRLGQISNSAEKGYLLRFNDGGDKGSLRFNSAVFGEPASGYVRQGDKMYIWNLNEWHVLSVVADGTNVRIYDNAELIQEYAQTTGEVFATLPFERFDISMTWDDGTGYDKGQAFLGYQAFTRIWNKALTAEEVAATLCDVDNYDGLEVYWAWNLDEGHVVANLGSAAGYDLDFTKALAGGQSSYVKAEDIEGAWTDVTEVDGLAPVCAE